MMIKDEYIKNLENLRNELEKIEKEFKEINPIPDWNSLRVIPLLDHIKNLIIILENYTYPKLDEKFEEVIKSDLEYFNKNLEGLKRVLDSEKKYFDNKDKGFRRTL
ncbi:MAG: hypothetical protein RXO36_05535 [Candidatus Nanopusillus acidilobi]